MTYRLIDDGELAPEIADMRWIVGHSFKGQKITQDLALGMMLWLTIERRLPILWRAHRIFLESFWLALSATALP